MWSPQIVRNAAGQAFETLYRNIGKRAIDEIVPALVQKLDQVCASLERRVRVCVIIFDIRSSSSSLLIATDRLTKTRKKMMTKRQRPPMVTRNPRYCAYLIWLMLCCAAGNFGP